jgi:hypothetical protein
MFSGLMSRWNDAVRVRVRERVRDLARDAQRFVSVDDRSRSSRVRSDSPATYGMT